MKKYELKIVQDENPESPRTSMDNPTTMICFHQRYNLGDKHNYNKNDFYLWDEIQKQIEIDYKVLMILPLYLYDHSGITISTGNFNDRWDSMRVGFVFVDEKGFEMMTDKVEDKTNEELLNRWIHDDVHLYDDYLRGEVYRYEVYEVEECSLGHEHRTLIESCGGYYGEESCRSEGENMLKYYETEKEEVG